MLRQTLFSLALCCVPAMADSIGSANFTFHLNTTYTGFHNDSVSGVNSLNYFQSDSMGTTDSAMAAFSGNALTGTTMVSQSFGPQVPNPPELQTTGQLLATVNLPASSGITITGSETVLDTDISTNTQFLNSILVNGVTTPFPITGNLGYPSQTTTLFIPNASGNPLTIALQFDPAVNQFRASDYISFEFTFDEASLTATPEPATWGMLGIAALTLPFVRRRLKAKL